jgi:hypothetical protein
MEGSSLWNSRNLVTYTSRLRELKRNHLPTRLVGQKPVNQTARNNYVELEIMNSLGRYFMVSFTYTLNKQLNLQCLECAVEEEVLA